MPGGHPTLYSEQMLTKARKYIADCKDVPSDYPGKVNVRIPTRGGMARALGVARDTLYEWSKVHPAFSDIMEELSSEQEDRLIQGGLSGTYNSTISKVLLTKHGYREGVDTTTNDKDLPTPLLNAIYNHDSNQEVSEPEEED